ncbi:MAG TPA: SRPBCC family protein [Acidimicrobiia bacterium]
MPSQTFTHTALTDAPAPVVWASLDEPETWEAIGGVDRVFNPTIDGDGRLRGFSFDTVAAGKRYVGVATPHRREEGRLMAWHIQNSEVRGITTVELDTHESQTAVSVTLEVESRGLLSGMFFPVIASAIGNGLPKAVDEFAAGLSIS